MRKGMIAGISLLVLHAGTALMMVRNFAADPGGPLLEGTLRYGHNDPDSLQDGLLAISIELLIAMAILRPWSDRGGVGRPALALALAVPFAMFSMMMSMHGGGVIAIHVMWTMLLAVFFLVMVIRRAITSLGSKRAAAD